MAQYDYLSPRTPPFLPEDEDGLFGFPVPRSTASVRKTVPVEDKQDNSSAFQFPQHDMKALDEALKRRQDVYAQRPAEPKPKWWQRLAAGAVGGLAGYANSSGRMRPIDVSGATQEILAPGYLRRLSDWAGNVEAAEAAVTGEQERQQAAMRNMQAQLQMENLQEQRAARAERIARQKKADEAADLARITQPGVEEIREEAPLETTVPSTVPGLPGQQISVPKPQKQYRAEFEQGGKRYGVRSSEEMAQEQARITQAAYPVITKKMAADLGQPELEGQRVPPNEFNEFVKMAQPVAPKSTDIDYQDYRDEVSGTVTRIGFDKKTGAEVSRQVLKGIERKRPPASSSAVAPGGMSNEEFKRSRGLQSDFDRSPILKIYPDIRSALDSMKSAAQQGDSVGDIALMRYFAKLTDPSTGVREEEYRALQGAQGALEKLKLWTSGEWLEGQKLTPALRQAFIRMADKVHENRVKQINSLMTTYRGRAKAAGVDPETIFGDWPTLIGGPGAPTAGAGKKDSLGIR